ncbi:MAG: acyl-CoA dehydratase activase, partial [Chloroflexota bacterium]
MEFFGGVDIGSATTKVAVIDVADKMAGYSIVPTGADGNKAAAECLNRISKSLACNVVDSLKYVIATGYGRERVSFASETVSEISCHARGAFSIFPEVRTVIDIGGQDSKVIAVGEDGWPVNFAMNDKCAAGTGRFLEVMSRVLEIDLDKMSRLSLQSEAPAQVSSMCTVFAESEVISLMSEGRKLEDVVAGIHQS